MSGPEDIKSSFVEKCHGSPRIFEGYPQEFVQGTAEGKVPGGRQEGQ